MGLTQRLFGVLFLLEMFYRDIDGQETPKFRNDYTFIGQTQSFYKFHSTRRSWQDAVNTCAAEGASLFYPVNKCEADEVVARWSETPAYGWAYIGVSSPNEGVFTTIDGRSILDIYSNWHPGEPNNANDEEKCVAILRDGTLNDVECGKSFPFICKKRQESSNGPAFCDKIESKPKFRRDYKYLEHSKSFYKIHTIFKKWRDAREMCKAEGAVLFYPKNTCEVNAVLDFWNQTQPFNQVFVGISSPTKGSFQTVDGQPVWDVYNNWAPGEPNNANGNEDCAVLIRDGIYNDVNCDLRLPFICKKIDDSAKQNAICAQVNTAPTPGINFRKDYKYFEDTQSLYKIHTIFQTWQDAKATCENEEATLLYPENECEANVVLEFWNQTQPFGWVYVGAYNPTNEATIRNIDTIDGRQVWQLFNNWRRGEPNNIGGEENCVVLLREGVLNDDRCDKKYAFVCKKALSKGKSFCDSTAESKKFRKDYTYIDQTQSFYKIHPEFTSWQEAKLTCEKEASLLYYPENSCEFDLVLDFWNQRQPFRRIYVGLSSTNQRGIFETVDGLPVWKMYSKWRPGEPDNVLGQEECVVLHRSDVSYTDENCNQKYPFICKKRLNPRKSAYGCDVPKKDESSLITFRNDYTYIEDTQSHYKIHTISGDWNGAKKMCEYEGATLFYPENECESNVIFQFLRESQPPAVDTVFLGIMSNKERIFESIDGRRGSDLYLKWAPNEPNNAGDNEYCVQYYQPVLAYNDIDCKRSLAFICKKKVNSSDRDALCEEPLPNKQTGGSFVGDYKYLNETQSLYKFHAKARNWQDAKKICSKEGASLFYPKNKCEVEAVLKLWTQTNAVGWIFVGIFSPEEGIFQTIDHEPISNVYSNWRPGEPNNANGGEKCVSLLRDGNLNDISCFKNLPFICKKVSDSNNKEATCDQHKNDATPGSEFRKDYTYLSDTKSAYKIHTLKHSWQEARQICASEGSTFFYPENKCEANVILEFWNQTQPFLSVFIGISSPSLGVFETVSGRPVWEVYNNWLPGEPNNANDKENCVILTRQGNLNDVECDKKYSFICKKKIVPNSEITVCDKPESDTQADLSFRKDYKYVQETQNFYKIHTILKPWEDAKETCAKEGTKLFFPENEQEVKAVLEFWRQTQPYNWVYVGISNKAKDRVPSISNFETIDGRPVKNVYNKWRLGEPNNANGEENCVVFTLDGTFNDDKCTNNYAFICKTTIDAVKGVKKETDADQQEISFRKDYTYLKSTHSFYKIHSIFVTWQDARQACMKEGAALFYPQNECEAKTVLGFWNETQVLNRAFIGVSSPNLGTFETIDGSPIWLVYNKWRPGQPDNENENESCVVIYRDGFLTDERCGAKLPFICRKIIASSKRSSCDARNTDKYEEEQRLIRKDYTYLENTKSLYKIHTVGRNWMDARKTCLKEGGTLFYPENKCEANTVLDFWKQTQPLEWVFLGISSPVTGIFETIDGRPIWEVYNIWHSGEPNNGDGSEGCVVIGRDTGQYNDAKCVNKGSFICKKRLGSQNGDAVCDKREKDKKQVDVIKDYTYLEGTQSLYKIHTIFRNWNDAVDTCIKEGATLFYPESQTEYSSVKEFWDETQNYNEVYVGLSGNNDGSFKTVNGATIRDVYNKWSSGKPVIAKTDQGCILLRREGTLDEDYCYSSHPFICKKSLQSLNWNVMCNTNDLNYKYDRAQDKCYKFYLTPMNWTEARDTCKSEQSHLAVINSQAEADLMVKITANAPKDNIPGDYLVGAIHLGFYRDKTDRWWTVTGQQLEDAGYAKWSYNQPDGVDTEFCGSMFHNGELNDLGCFHKCFFICELEIATSSDT